MDESDWKILADKRQADTDLSHDLVVNEAGVRARYVRLTVYAVPYSVAPCISGLRVFGKGNGSKPKPAEVSAIRSGPLDFIVSTSDEQSTVGYNVLWGNTPEQLYHSWMVMGTQIDRKRIGALVEGQDYYVRVDAFNENGITEGKAEKL